MITQEHIHTLSGRDVHDRDGDKIGTAGQVWTDAAGLPTWVSVRTGLFGLNESLVPLQDADLRDDRLVVPFDKATVKDAPNVDASHDEPLTQAEVDQLYSYYGVNQHDSYRSYQAGATATNENYTGDSYTDENYTGQSRPGGTDYELGAGQGDGHLRGDDAMTRSEERLTVGTERERTGKARLRKYVTTEQQQVSVPVTREEVRLEREPVTDANRDAAFSGPDLTESEHEVTLHEERPVVQTETVPVERVRLGKETVTDERTVSGEVRKEQIEAELPGDERRRRLG
ncbi:photosystem reaction center subunit H [Actinoplanes sp. SE50]|uniref:DUF2382 domain-containing protein n=1 Tax=unclassified Actinoplanes TaxID=2626549 RepID=UPI00023EC94B|nr:MULTISPECIES: PRC and DUF2382 domain-containing protein [unclassified Actinoplanes]AEV83713.1 uncharacterized protein ACPL_2818 [Actinoplanes sp. SE50/110]ATO82143.1 photosystem reaction center subunit H [Actinoplanes sp. SE50]SLL99550.1 photosystem reaction center subunit H [Actinoplanes sp. SE50/110]